MRYFAVLAITERVRPGVPERWQIYVCFAVLVNSLWIAKEADATDEELDSMLWGTPAEASWNRVGQEWLGIPSKSNICKRRLKICQVFIRFKQL